MIWRVEKGALQIRRGRLDDLPALAAFTKNTFEWGDYISSVWERWVTSERGELLVAELDGKFAGTVHVQYLQEREAWLEGVRVHPDLRRQNIATALIQTAHMHARKKRCRTMRLETSAHNVNARRLFERLGYVCRIEYVDFEAAAREGKLEKVRAAKLSDVDACMATWQSSQVIRATQSLVPSMYGWRWWNFSESRLRQAVRAKNVWVTENGRAFMVTRLRDSLDVILLAGQKRDTVALLEASKVLAKRENVSHAYWLTLKHARMRAWAHAAGFVPDDVGMLIYEYVL